MKNKMTKCVAVILLVGILTCLLSACGHRHEFGEWIIAKEATCTESGFRYRVCLNGGEQETEVIPANGEHQYSEKITLAPTCSAPGEKTLTCALCNDCRTEEIAAATYTSTEIYDMYLPSVGEVITYDRSGKAFSLGSCFVYSEDGRLITNYHVIEESYSAKVIFGEKEYTVEKVLAYDKEIDVAVLKINATDLTPAVLCSLDHKVGATVYAFGSSEGLTATFSDGCITAKNREIDGVSYTQHDAPISGGNSGGPLINEFGEVIGINTWTMRDSQNLNFAINVSELDGLDYGTPLTVAELYNKECNAYQRLKSYIIENGTYNESDNYYRLIADTSYSSDYTSKYTRAAYYYVEDEELTLDIVLDDGEYWAYFTVTDDVDGEYFWSYFDDDDHKMNGILYASTFTSSTLLGYADHNITNSTLRDSVRELASSMISYLCTGIALDYLEIGLTAEDFGFLKY